MVISLLSDRCYRLGLVNAEQLGKPIVVFTAVPTTAFIEEVKQRHPCLWSQLSTHFYQVVKAPWRHARALSLWHFVLMLAAG